MKVLFAHDHIFRQDSEGEFYTAGSFNNDVWRRYLEHFQELTVIARLSEKKVNSGNTYNKFDLSKTSFRPIPSLSGPIAQFKNRTVASKIIKEELIKADVLIARLPSEIGNLAIDIAEQIDKPYIVEVVACVWDALWNYGNMQAKLYAPIAMKKMKKRVQQSSYTVYVTNKFLQHRYPSNSMSENISNVEINNTNEEALSLRLKRYQANQRLYTIGTIGSLNNKIKGLETSLKALSTLNKKGVNFQFQILGDGNQNGWREVAREYGIEDKVKFCGVLPGGEPVLKWLDDIDLYIQPSYQEGLPRAVIEAMSRGCPVIGSTAGGIPELIDNDFIHEPGNYKELSKLIQELLFDIETSAYLARQNIDEAKGYIKDILDRKRNDFFKKIIDQL